MVPSGFSENLDFWWSVPQKRKNIDNFGARDDPTTYQNQEVHWWNRAVEVCEADEVNEVAEVLRPGKSLLSTSESSSFLNSALFWCLKIILGS